MTSHLNHREFVRPDPHPDLESRRRLLKAQQEALRRGQTPPLITPSIETDREVAAESCTQVTTGHSATHSHSQGSQEKSSNAGGAQEERNGGTDREPMAHEPDAPQMPLIEYVQFAAEKNRAALQYAKIMDRAYEGQQTRQLTVDLGMTPVVPPKSNRAKPWEYDREMYRRRNEIERLFRRLKGFRKDLFSVR